MLTPSNWPLGGHGLNAPLGPLLGKLLDFVQNYVIFNQNTGSYQVVFKFGSDLVRLSLNRFKIIC